MTNYPPPPPPTPTPANHAPKTRLRSRKWFPWAAGALTLIVGLAIGGAAGSSGKDVKAEPGPTVTATATTTATVTSQPTNVVATKTVTATVTYTPAPVDETSDGQYLVGSEITPGTWHTDGGTHCYYERDSDLTGGLTSIIANDNITGPTTIQIAATDKAVKFNGGCTWSRIG